MGLAHDIRMAKLDARYQTGALVRTNPLPVGRYWIDIFPDGIADWVGWSGGNLATVSVEKTELYEGTSKIAEWLGWIYPWVPTPTNPDKTVLPDRVWVIFNVSAPTEWTIAGSVGWPSTAPKGVIETSDDTVQKPDPYAEQEDRLKWIKYSAYGLVGVVGLLAVAKLVRG